MALTIGGRTFSPPDQQMTAAQDNYLMGYLYRVGVMEIVSDPRLGSDEKNKQLLINIMLSGDASNILAALVTETGKTWTMKDANANAAMFGDIVDEQEKALMRNALVGFVAAFFRSGEVSSPTSPKFSAEEEEVPATANEEAATSGILV